MQSSSISTTLPQTAYWYPARLCTPSVYAELSHKQHTGILQECADLYYMYNSPTDSILVLQDCADLHYMHNSPTINKSHNGIVQDCAHLHYMYNSPTNSILVSCKILQTFTIIMYKIDLCKGGIFSTAFFNSDIQLSLYFCPCFIPVCPFVALVKATYAENSHIAVSCRFQNAFIFNVLCVFICFL